MCRPRIYLLVRTTDIEQWSSPTLSVPAKAGRKEDPRRLKKSLAEYAGALDRREKRALEDLPLSNVTNSCIDSAVMFNFQVVVLVTLTLYPLV